MSDATAVPRQETLAEQRHQMAEDGYCLIPNVLDQAFMCQLINVTTNVVAAISSAHREERKSTGSLVHIDADPFYAQLIAYEPALNAIRTLTDASDLRWSTGYLVSKPGPSPALFWHQDWWAWDNPISYAAAVPQIFVMYYFTETTPYNGCLRVIPGSHRKRHALHDLAGAHTDGLSRYLDSSNPAYASHHDEVAIRAKPGDMVVGDARLLHGTYPNQSPAERPLLVLWYHPHFASLPGPIKKRLVANYQGRSGDTDIRSTHAGFPDYWPLQAQQMLRTVEPVYEGPEAPEPTNRTPDRRLT